MNNLLRFADINNIKQMNYITNVALLEMQKTNSIKDNEEFGILFEAYDYIVNTNPDSPIVDILSKITVFNG